VFAEEPLPAAHGFWRHPRVAVTPHVCGPLIPEDVAPHFIANVKAFLENRPLSHLVDVGRQY
jgi:glyoxylate/hydroxypyruvate reductase A